MADTGVDAVRLSERVRGVLQLRGRRAVRGWLVPDVFRGVVLLCADRATQPELGSVVERDMLDALRAVAQDRWAGGCRENAQVPGGHMGCSATGQPWTVPCHPLRRACVPGGVLHVLALLHVRSTADLGGCILVQRYGADGRLRTGVRAVLRAVPWVRPRQRHGRGVGRGPRPSVRGSVADPIGRRLRRAVHARGPRESGVRARDAIAVGLQHRPRHHARVSAAGDRVHTGRYRGIHHVLPSYPALRRVVHFRAAHVVRVHDRRSAIWRGIAYSYRKRAAAMRLI